MKESVIHIGINPNEAIELKKEILSSQIDLIKVQRVIRKYKLLRLKELRLKERLRRDMSGTITLIKNLQKMLPKGKVPKIEHGIEEEKPNKEKIKTYKPVDKKKMMEEKMFDSLENELQEIQNKLKMLG